MIVDRKYVDKIIELAKFSYDNDEVPVGAIVVKNGEIIGIGYNNREKEKCIYGHAEIMAIDMACKSVDDWRLDNCELYVTLKPCMMCCGAILESRIKKIYYLCNKTNVRIPVDKYLKSEKILDDLKESEYLKLLQLFFENKRI